MRKAFVPLLASLLLCGAATSALVATGAQAQTGTRNPVMLAQNTETPPQNMGRMHRFNPADIAAMTAFGVLGYLMRKFDFPLPPLVLAFVIGPIMETALRQSLIMSGGDFAIFVSRPVAGTLIIIAVLVAIWPALAALVGAHRGGVRRSGTPQPAE